MVNINTTKFQITVITPVYNRKHTLQRAIDSLTHQTFKDFEHIIVDDGSSVDIFPSIKKYLKSFSGVKYIKHFNRNTPLSLNTGLKLASGNYTTFLDSDDEYKQNHLEIRFKYMEKNKKIDFIHSDCKIIGNKNSYFVPDARNPNKLIHLSKCIIGATIFGKTHLFFRLNGFNNIFGYDYDFIERAKVKFVVKKIKSPTYIYYRNSNDSVLDKIKSNININLNV